MKIVVQHYVIGFIVNILMFILVLSLITMIKSLFISFDTILTGIYLGLLVFLGQSLSDILIYKIKYKDLSYTILLKK